MLLSNAKRQKIQGIIKRIAQDKSITLEERIFVEKFAHHNSTISLWLKKANSFRRNGTKNDGGLDNLLQSFGIDGLDKENHFNPLFIYQTYNSHKLDKKNQYILKDIFEFKKSRLRCCMIVNLY